MKTLLHHSYSLLLMGLALLACDRESCGNDPASFCDNHYIGEFSIPSYGYADARSNDRNRNGRYDQLDEVWLDFVTVPSGSNIYSTGNPTFEALVEELGDNMYKVKGPGINVLLHTVLRIDVTCSSAYDAQHAAGDTLNDLFLVEYSHAKFFIDNGYSRDFEGFDLPEGIEHVTHDLFRESLDNFNSHGEDNFPVGRYFQLHPQSPPDQAGKYTFTVKMTTNRRTYLDSTSFEWQGPIPP